MNRGHHGKPLCSTRLETGHRGLDRDMLGKADKP